MFLLYSFAFHLKIWDLLFNSMVNKKLLNKVLWFKEKIKYDIDFFDIIFPQRIVGDDSRYNSGVFFSTKCNRNIQYESGLELDFIQQLEKNDEILFYWEQPVKVPYRRGKAKDVYTPDFALYLRTKEIVLVEVKTLTDMLDYRVQMKMEGLLHFCSKRGFGLLFTDGKEDLGKFRKQPSNVELEKTILSRLQESRTLRKTECREIIKQCHATQAELMKCIIRHNLKFKSRSFKLEADNRNKLYRHVFINKKKYEEFDMDKYHTLFLKK